MRKFLFVLISFLLTQVSLNAVINTRQSFELYLSNGETQAIQSDGLFYTDYPPVKIKANSSSIKVLKNEVVFEGTRGGGSSNVVLTATDAKGENKDLVVTLLYQRKTYDYTFRYPSNNSSEKIYAAGEFNGWNAQKDRLTYKDGAYTLTLKLAPGKYQYKFVVNGNWIPDPNNPNKASDGFGGYNSLAITGKFINNAPELFPYALKQDNSGTKVYIKYVKNDGAVLQKVSVIDNNQIITPKFDTDTIYFRVSGKGIHNLKIFASDNVGNMTKILRFRIPALTDRFYWQDAVLYFAFTDRFYNGDKSNDSPIKDPDLSKKGNYQGGDWAGIIDKIKDGYFSKLGVNALWISPVNDNPAVAYRDALPPHRKFSGYHGYWPVSDKNVEEHFGTKDELLNLVENAHSKNIKVLFDFVANHMHKQSALYKQHPDWFGPVVTSDGETNIRLFDKYPLTTWFDWFLPAFDYVHSDKAVDFMTDNALYWIENYSIDGFREDAVKHIPHNFWRELKSKIVKKIELPQNKVFYQVGETIDSREKIKSYVNSGELDGQFDFPLYWAIRDVFAFNTRNFYDLDKEIKASEKVYGSDAKMSVFLGNHDFSRFISYAAGDVKPNTDEKAVGWNNPPKVPGPQAFKKMRLAFAFVMTQNYVPLIYYGDEIGLPGAADPDNRRMMQFDNLTPDQISLKKYVAELIKIRKANPAFAYGKHETLYLTAEQYVYGAFFFNNEVIVALNRADKSADISFSFPKYCKTPFEIENLISGQKYNVADGRIKITIPAGSALFFKAK